MAAESSDLMHRVRFDGEEASVENTFPIGELFNEIEGPHGVAVDPAGEHIYVSTAHGVPDGKLWKIQAGSDEVVADPIDLGRFPATLDITPDGLYAFVVNFNLHGAMEPSSVSVVYLPDFVEVAQAEVGIMPHGSRVSPDGYFQYSALMMEDVVVELDTRSFEVNRKFSVAIGEEGPVSLSGRASYAGGNAEALRQSEMEVSCSPTWAQPSATGEYVYVACNAANQVLEIEVEGWELTRRFATGEGPYNIDVTADGRLLVVTLKQGDGVAFIDLERGEVLATRDSSTRVTHGVVTSPDSRYAFVSVEGIGGEPGKVDVYDLESFEQVASVEVGKQAGGIAFWKME